jgi:site-specific DNA recombinase
MTPTHASTGSKRFRYYVTRLEPGDDKNGVWRLPSGEIERLVIDALAEAIVATAPVSGEANIIQDQMAANGEIANRLQNTAVYEKREILLDQKVRVQVQKEQVIISFQIMAEAEQSEVCIDAKLAKQGSELKFTIPPTNANIKPAPNPILQKLVAQAFAAQDLLLTGEPNPALSDYSRRYLGQLVRISWLAPDIIAAIMDGTQPVNLTGRKLTRANAIPLDWPSQRKMFGFA